MNRVSKEKAFFLAFAVLLCLCRFYSAYCLKDVFSDEMEIVNHAAALAQNGADAAGNKWPLYVTVGMGIGTYTFLYPLAAFCFFFGAEYWKIRVFLQAVTICACGLMGKGVSLWTGRKQMFWLTFLTALALPWGFVQANRIWDPAFVPIYFALYFYFFCAFMKKDLSAVKRRVYVVISLGALVLLAVVYPPCRIPAVAVWIFSVVWGLRERKIDLSALILSIVCCSILSIPLAWNMFFNSSFNDRTMFLLVFRGENLPAELFAWLNNFAANFSPGYLFLTGDIIDRHSLPILGVLGTISIVPMLQVIRHKASSLEILQWFIIFWTIVSVAATNDYQPHTLRACLCWPAYAILIAFGWDQLFRSTWGGRRRYLWYAASAGFFAVFFAAYVAYFG